MQFGKMLVIDLECTCFRDEDTDKPVGWTSSTDQEITEIGAVIVDLVGLSIMDVKSFLVRPEGPMGKFCEELTTLTYAHVKDKQPIQGAIGELKDWCKKFKFDIGSMPWASWGDFDRIQFERECERKGIKYPFGRCHYNYKGIFSMLKGSSKGYGMEKALSMMNMDMEGTHHRGVDDAFNTAKIVLKQLADARGAKPRFEVFRLGDKVRHVDGRRGTVSMMWTGSPNTIGVTFVPTRAISRVAAKDLKIVEKRRDGSDNNSE